ncbi:MAG: hypothetical protein ACFFA7_00290 [Promethearchaeota archaeon]
MEESEIFSPTLLKIEEDIIRFLSNSPLFFTKDQFINQIRAYFITRKNLTQKKLQKITKLSLGKISQVLKTLIRWRLIEKTDVSSTGEYTYSMESIDKALVNYFTVLTKQMEKFIKPLEELKNKLDNGGEKIKNLRGYDKINKLLPLFLDAIKVNIEIMKEFSIEFF